MSIQKIDVEKVAAAIEADAGEALPDLRQALAEAKAGIGRVTTPEILLCHAPRNEEVQCDFIRLRRGIETPLEALRDGEQVRLDSLQRYGACLC